MNRICNASNIKIDKKNYLKNRAVCKSCYKKTEKNHINSIIQNEFRASRQKPKTEKTNYNINNQTLILWFSYFAKTYPMSCILLQKQELIYINAKSESI